MRKPRNLKSSKRNLQTRDFQITKYNDLRCSAYVIDPTPSELRKIGEWFLRSAAYVASLKLKSK